MAGKTKLSQIRDEQMPKRPKTVLSRMSEQERTLRAQIANGGQSLGMTTRALDFAGDVWNGYLDRTGEAWHSGLDQANQGAEAVRGGDLSGLVSQFLGPVNAAMAPVTGLFPSADAASTVGSNALEAIGGDPRLGSAVGLGLLGAAQMAIPGPGGKVGKLSNVADAGHALGTMGGTKVPRGLGNKLSDLRPIADAARTEEVFNRQFPGERKPWAKPLANEHGFTGSTVVDTEGHPRVMYHATGKVFDEFKTSPDDIGIHFGTRDQSNFRIDKTSNMFGGDNPSPHTRPVFLDVKNPIRLNDPGSWGVDDIKNQLHWLVNPKRAINQGKHQPFSSKEIDAIKSLPQARKLLESKGFDGIVYENTYEVKNHNYEDSYIVFRGDQVKSAIGSVGQREAKPYRGDTVDSPHYRADPVEDLGTRTEDVFNRQFPGEAPADPGITAYHGKPKK